MNFDYSYILNSLLEWYGIWLSIPKSDLLAAGVFICFIAFIAWESIKVTDVKSRALMLPSYATNIATFVFNNILMSLLSISALLSLAEKTNPFGLLRDYNRSVQFLAIFFAYDLILYIWHRLNHQYDGLWMFHKVHHSDPSMNSTTAFRVHFIEVIFTTVLKAGLIVLTGVEALVVAACEAVSAIFAIYHHLNFSFAGENRLKWLFITPSLHRVHHSKLRLDHDSNYGAVFSFWDRLFHSFIEPRPVETGLENVRSLNFIELIKYGFTVKIPTYENPLTALGADKLNAMIAEAAYYLSERRNFAPGFEQLDWLEAERQIKQYRVGF